MLEQLSGPGTFAPDPCGNLLASPPLRANTLDVASEQEERATVRAFISSLMEAAEQLPDGLDSPIDLAICDGHNLQFIDQAEVTWQRQYDTTSGQFVRGKEMCVLIKGHWHQEESPGRLLRGVVSGIDEELRKLTQGDAE